MMKRFLRPLLILSLAAFVMIAAATASSLSAPLTRSYAAQAAAGTVTEFPIPTAGSEPYGIKLGSDGKLWFPEYLGNNIGRITTK